MYVHLEKMKKNKFGEMIFDSHDLCDAIMQGRDIWNIKNITVDTDIDIGRMSSVLDDTGELLTWTVPENSDTAISDWDSMRQKQWFMPQNYHDLDIAKYLLDLCDTEVQLQRVGQELLLYQKHDLFDLLRYMKYLTDTMKDNNIIWGMGRGSSVSSYVLYLLGVHRIDSLYYDLDPHEFLR